MRGLSVEMVFAIALGIGFAAWVINKDRQPWSEKWHLLVFVSVALVIGGMFVGDDSCELTRGYEC